MENRAFVINVPAKFATTITISAAKRLTTLTGWFNNSLRCNWAFVLPQDSPHTALLANMYGQRLHNNCIGRVSEIHHVIVEYKLVVLDSPPSVEYDEYSTMGGDMWHSLRCRFYSFLVKILILQLVFI